MNKISFEEAGSLLVTFHAGEGVKEGQVVKVSQNGTVAPCSAGDLFCGLAVTCKDGAAGVQVQGFAQVKVTLPVSLGWASLVADGQGGVKQLSAAAPASAGEGGTGAASESSGSSASAAGAGVTALVVDVDTAGKSAVIYL